MNRAVGKTRYVATAGTVWLWGAVLAGIWGRLFDVSAPSLWISLTAALAAFAVGLAVPSQLVRVGWVMLRWAYGRAAMPLVSPRTDAGDEPAQLTRVMGVSLLVAAGLSLVSAAALLTAALAVGAIGRAMFFSAPHYRLLQGLLQLAAMLPWGVGAGMVWQMHALARDAQRPVGRACEDWLWGLALAAAGAWAAWRWALWLPMVGLLAAVQVGLGLLWVRWPVQESARGGAPAVARQLPRARWGVLLAAAAWSVATFVQIRGSADLWGAAPGEQLLFGAAWLALLGVFYRHWSASRAAQTPETVAAGVLLAGVALAVQMTLGWLCLAAGPAGRWLAALAAATAVPLAAALSMLIAVVRQRFLDAGGQPRRWVQRTLIGAAAGLAVMQIGLAAGVAVGMWVALLTACLVVALVAGISSADRPAKQLTWAVAGAALLSALALGLTRAARAPLAEQGLRLSGGAWLTPWQQGEQVDYLPVPACVGDWRLDLLAGRLLGLRAVAPPGVPAGGWAGLVRSDVRSVLGGGHWLAVIRRPIARGGVEGVVLVPAAADEAVFDLPSWRGRSAGAEGFPSLQVDPRGFAGVIYSPMRADHPSARAVFCADTLSMLRSRIRAEGVLLVHAACAGDGAAAALAVARTVFEAFGPSPAVVRAASSGPELLIVVPIGGTPEYATWLMDVLRAEAGPDAVVLNTTQLEALWADVPSVAESTGPPCGAGASVPAFALADYIRRVGGD